MFIRFLTSFLFLFLVSFFGMAQLPDCTLGLGSAETETLVGVFQLNEQQKATLAELQGRLEVEGKSIEDQTKKLFEDHPQGTEEELITLAQKYKALQQKMVDISKESDRQLLMTFNEKQYELYVDLCHEALRNPIDVVPATYDAPVDPE